MRGGGMISLRVMQEENDLLVQCFLEEELKTTVFQMEHNKSPALMAFRWNSTKSFGT
jgi:hypothetical protein